MDDAARAADWIRTHHGAVLAPEGLTAGFHAHLLTFPWAGHGINWSGIPHMSLSLEGVSNELILAWARRTPAGSHQHLLVVDSADSPGIVCRFEDGMVDLDTVSVRPELYMCEK